MSSKRLWTPSRRTILSGAAASLAAPAIVRAQSAPVKVGVLLPTSGILAYSGQVAARGVQLAATVAKESGAPAIEVISYDTQSKPETGRTGVESLVNAGCSVLIGAWDSAATISAAQACEALKVPLVAVPVPSCRVNNPKVLVVTEKVSV